MIRISQGKRKANPAQPEAKTQPSPAHSLPSLQAAHSFSPQPNPFPRPGPRLSPHHAPAQLARTGQDSRVWPSAARRDSSPIARGPARSPSPRAGLPRLRDARPGPNPHASAQPRSSPLSLAARSHRTDSSPTFLHKLAADGPLLHVARSLIPLPCGPPQPRSPNGQPPEHAPAF